MPSCVQCQRLKPVKLKNHLNDIYHIHILWLFYNRTSQQYHTLTRAILEIRISFLFFSCHQLVYEKWEALAFPNQISLLFSLSYTHFNSGAAAVAIRICRPPLHVALSSYCSGTMWRKLREKISQTQSDLMGPFSRHLQHWLCESLRGAITDNIKLNKDEKWHFRSPCRCDV